MKAAIFHSLGPAEVLKVEDVPIPEIKSADEVSTLKNQPEIRNDGFDTARLTLLRCWFTLLQHL